MRLSDLVQTMPVDGTTGGLVTDHDGIVDDPADYHVFDIYETDDGFVATVGHPERGNDVDLVVSDATGTRIYLGDDGFDVLFEKGEGDAWWSIEEGKDGALYMSSNADTRRMVNNDMYRGWDADSFREDLRREGMEESLVERFLEQADL